MIPLPPRPTLFPYTTLFRSLHALKSGVEGRLLVVLDEIDTVEEHLPAVAADLRALERNRQGIGGELAEAPVDRCARSEEHTSELQSRFDLVCRLLLEKKKEY